MERREERAWEKENVNERTGIKLTNLPHIRGSPDVTGTRKRNGIREEGNEGHIRFGDAAFWVNELNFRQQLRSLYSAKMLCSELN